MRGRAGVSRKRRRPSLRVERPLLAFLAAFCSVVVGHTQSGGPSQPADGVVQPTFRTEASYVRVDVYPTVNGVPVTDLTKDDFEVLEDNTPQRVDQFEYVQIQTGVPQDVRREPSTVAQSRAMALEPRSRVFIVFLDTYHTGVAGSARMRSALATLLNGLLSADDLYGVMTPEMSARDVTLARKTELTEGMLAKYWAWGRRNEYGGLDPEEAAYVQCFPTQITGTTSGDAPRGVSLNANEKAYSGVAEEMIERRREKLTFDALGDLVDWLRDIREERKAVVTISDGWRLFTPNEALTRAGSPPELSGLGTNPAGGLTADVAASRSGIPYSQCDRDRLYLASLDNATEFRRLLDRSNRSNVAFYPVDSRGLPAFDSPIGGEPGRPLALGPVSLGTDSGRLTQRISTLQTLAEATDGLAVVNSNAIERGLQRIVSDLSAYYLLGYYSTNSKLDGRFRSIKVRVKRPGVSVRARRGYLAATEKEMESRPTAAPLPVAPSQAAFERAMGGLAGLRPDARVRVHVAWVAPSEEPSPLNHVWAVAEIDRNVKGPEWAAGARVDAMLTTGAGASIASQTATVAAGQRSAAIDLANVALPPGELVLRLRVAPAGGGLPFMETVRFSVPRGSGAIGAPRVWRRGPETGPQFVVTGNTAFRRSETLRLDVPVTARIDSAAAELLDRSGKTMNIPVAARVTSPGVELSWATGEVALAPLAAGDYAIKITLSSEGTTRDVITAFRIVP
ncbi:MAG: VWA domain-containing protein [Vicinamibacterales bacterium]